MVGKIKTHPATHYSPYALLDELTEQRDDIKFIVGVIQYKDGDMKTMNSPCQTGDITFASYLLQADILKDMIE